MNQNINMVAAEIKYHEDFKKWAEQISEALTESIHLCDLRPDKVVGGSFFDRCHCLQIKISNLIERGRWFYPNVNANGYGADKELGYSGYRHELLDGLVSAYQCLQRLDCENLENNQFLRKELTHARKHFVGRVQKILDLDERRQEWGRIRSKVSAKSKSDHM